MGLCAALRKRKKVIEMQHTKLLCDISELNHLFRDSISIQNFLQQIVSLVQGHLQTDVCSIYLYDDADRQLTLKATVGLDPSSIGNVKLKLGEGITGSALETGEIINVCNASEHPKFKAFSGINEERFSCFMAVPVIRGIEHIGVITLQRTQEKPFSEVDEIVCRAVASQIGNMIENARFLMAFEQAPEKALTSLETRLPGIDSGKQIFIKGKSASKGLAHAKVKVYQKKSSFMMMKNRASVPVRRHGVCDFHKAVSITSRQLESLQRKVDDRLDDAASLIFASHLLILKDNSFVGRIEDLVKNGEDAIEAIVKVSQGYIDLFNSSDNIFIKEKAQDVEDIAERMIKNILSDFDLHSDIEGRVVVARDMFPSELLKLTGENAAGVLLVSGGVTSHISILANSLGLPMVIANRPELLDIEDGLDILLDGDSGNIYLNPDKHIIEEYQSSFSARKALDEGKVSMASTTLTSDGERVMLLANINLLSDIQPALNLKCDGVGLYRTEFPFIIRSSFPTEEEQYVVYRKLVEQMKGKPVTFRTLDVGGDKMLSYYHDATEQNPAIGLRSIRFSLKEKKIFNQQIRAILRAGKGNSIGIMFPMISSLDEFDSARQTVRDCIEQLKAEGIAHNSAPQIGIMVELPSVVEQIDEFAAEADFLSIGTNDFVQFMLGVDRTNELVEQFYMPHHPSVLRGLSKIIAGADKAGKSVSICGVMAGEPGLTAFLLGIGLRRFSVTPAHLPALQRQVQQLDTARCRQFADEILSKSRASQIQALLQKGIE
jgi:phosphotransferase system enzyme I (PtsP)